MYSVLYVIDLALGIYQWCIIIYVVLGWLIAFNVLNTSNQFVAMLAEFFFRITNPALALIRRFVPSFGNIDISPIILILVIILIRMLIWEYGLSQIRIGG